jgi:2-dehydro-3-deoxyglucarate aldolase/4-hydroxy-2-oxoheptanedioate aldolase
MQKERLINRTKEALKRGERVVGSSSSEVACLESIQMFAAAGLDYVMIDTEHSAYDEMTLRRLVGTARMAGITPVVRVPDVQYHLIARVLDMGALGIMVPRVGTREDVEELVAAVKYPPWGKRGCGAVDLQNDFLPTSVAEHIARANEETLIIIQIELREAVERIEELVSVEGVDVAMMGPVDLTVSLGIPGEFQSPIFLQAVERVIEACEKAGVASGTHVRTYETVEFWANKGMRFLTCTNDMLLLIDGIEELGRRLVALRAVGSA